jgi:DNA-binding LytR/AlgR family response regulator
VGITLQFDSKVVINGYYVKSIEKENNKHILLLQNGKKIPLSRRQYSKIRIMIKQ